MFQVRPEHFYEAIYSIADWHVFFHGVINDHYCSRKETNKNKNQEQQASSVHWRRSEHL